MATDDDSHDFINVKAESAWRLLAMGGAVFLILIGLRIFIWGFPYV